LKGEKQRRCKYIWIAGADQASSGKEGNNERGEENKTILPSLPLSNPSLFITSISKRKNKRGKKN